MRRRTRTLTFTHPPPRLLAPVPRWLGPVLAGWLVIGAVAMTMATGLPRLVEAVLAGWGLLALGHGLVHRRWWVAGPITAAAAALLAGSVLGWLPAGVSLHYDGGPAGSAAPTLIWSTLFGVVGLNIAWASFLHGQVRRTLRSAGWPAR